MSALREYTAMKYMGDCKCGKCQLVPRTVLDEQNLYIDRLQDIARRVAELPYFKNARIEALVRDANDALGIRDAGPWPQEAIDQVVIEQTRDDWAPGAYLADGTKVKISPGPRHPFYEERTEEDGT